MARHRRSDAGKHAWQPLHPSSSQSRDRTAAVALGLGTRLPARLLRLKLQASGFEPQASGGQPRFPQAESDRRTDKTFWASTTPPPRAEMAETEERVESEKREREGSKGGGTDNFAWTAMGQRSGKARGRLRVRQALRRCRELLSFPSFPFIFLFVDRSFPRCPRVTCRCLVAAVDVAVAVAVLSSRCRCRCRCRWSPSLSSWPPPPLVLSAAAVRRLNRGPAVGLGGGGHGPFSNLRGSHPQPKPLAFSL